MSVQTSCRIRDRIKKLFSSTRMGLMGPVCGGSRKVHQGLKTPGLSIQKSSSYQSESVIINFSAVRSINVLQQDMT
ncbi:hypothetical protein RRG08_025629 [Elysia crispata]|uniref:Uncharacterized protein n=1 Tax=Elysia crispata TaxID=231223 RepID=A0AAE0YEN5_9GAST|nr:hypothetical protein RRG08_025629 [Elysia crispata]